MNKLDFKQINKPFYTPKAGRPEILSIPNMQFASISGEGDPNTSSSFQDAIKALYSLVYGLKFSRKKAGLEPDFTIGALEGLWWTKSGKQYDVGAKGDWQWTLMIWLPEFITASEFTQFVAKLSVSKPNPMLASARLIMFEEGQVVQILHIGPYDAEQPSVQLMHAFAADQGFAQSGKHHEIYLGDPRRSAPEKLRTIIRHPISKITSAP